MSPRLERPRPCPECGKPTRNHEHVDGSHCEVRCPRCGAEVIYNIAGDSLDHPTVESWEACGNVVGGPSICAQVAS